MKACLIALTAVLIAMPARANDGKPAAAKPILVPYRLSATNHVLVRAKINGKGPFNFIVDTGAPALFVMTKAAEKAGVEIATQGLSSIDRFEIEGGVVIENGKGRVEDLFQMEGINGMGLAGVELHGVIGYNVLARYRIEYDFTRDKLAWTPLDFQPPALSARGAKGGALAGLEMMGKLMKFAGAMLGVNANSAVAPRGFLGAELAAVGEAGVKVEKVLTGSPAEKAGLRAGDRVKSMADKRVQSVADAGAVLATMAEGARLSVTVERDGQERQIVVELGRGL
jgi:hypothetical protein